MNSLIQQLKFEVIEVSLSEDSRIEVFFNKIRDLSFEFTSLEDKITLISIIRYIVKKLHKPDIPNAAAISMINVACQNLYDVIHTEDVNLTEKQSSEFKNIEYFLNESREEIMFNNNFVRNCIEKLFNLEKDDKIIEDLAIYTDKYLKEANIRLFISEPGYVAYSLTNRNPICYENIESAICDKFTKIFKEIEYKANVSVIIY